jgi:hypothetical protein
MTAFQTFTAGQILTASQVSTLQANSTQVAIFQDQKANGTGGGQAAGTSAFQKRTLNATVVNNIAACSIASSVITLTAGTYFVNAVAQFYKTDSTQLRLRNTTAGSNLAVGHSLLVASTANIMNPATLAGYFTLTGSTNIELQYWVTNSINTNDLGVAASTSSGEVYATLTIQQVA